MSLKDQLLKAGLVSKKDVRKSNQEEREERRQQQAHREAKAAVEARERAARQAELDRALREKIEARQAREREREQAQMRRQAEQILGSHRVRFRSGNQRFWHPSPDRRHLHRLDLPGSVADDLHRGRLAVAYRGPADAFEPEIVLVPRAAAERVRRLAPERILFHNDARPEDPADMLLGTDA